MDKIKNISLFFRIVFQIFFALLPLVLILGWIFAPQPLILLAGIIQIDVIPRVYSAAILHHLTSIEKIIGLLISSIPLCIELSILFYLIRLFRLYEKGEIFSALHVRCIRNIGYALIFGQLINPLYEGIMGVILTWSNAHGHRFASVSFDQTNFGILLTGLLVILISWIVAEGCKLHEEHQLII